MDNPQRVQIEVAQSDTHRPGEPWSIRELHFEPESASAVEDQEVELSTLVGRPEVGISGPQSIQDVLDDEALPARAGFSWNSRGGCPRFGSWRFDSNNVK